jgi:DNA-binding CsgD family transcriptional regulator
MGSGSAFVGRAAELALLAEQAATAGRGEGRAVLIGGEPGIGKTRLAGEVAARAAAAGTRWVRSRAVQDEGCPPYWMFGQVVRELAATHEPNESQRADLAVLSPGARPGAVPPDALAGRRFAVFESVREYLTDAAADTGLVLVFDDVHWADAPSLRLLRHLAAGLGAARLLLLITYRDTETGGRDELTGLLAALAREETVSRIRLTGLSQDEVAEQLTAVTGGAVAPEVAAAIGRRTHGNPFFVAELGRLHSASSGWSSPGSLPEAVRDTVRVRLHDLTPGCREVLCAAAVLGADLDPAAVAAVTGREVAAVLAALDEAAAAGIVVAGPGWCFGHDLVRETARLELPTAGRLAVHARMGAYLRGRPDAAPAMIAHHLLEALPIGDAGAAASWAERAAAAAMAQLAWEDAAVFYARAVRAVPGAGSAARVRRLCGLALARLRGFDLTGGSSTLREAAGAARSAGDPALIGEVALVMEGYTDPGWVSLGKALCDEALAGLPPADSPLRARLLARRAAEATYHWEPEAGPLSGQALAMAERLGDPQALRSALRARQLARGGPEGAPDRVELGARMLALGAADGDDEAVLWGRLWRADAFAQLGRVGDCSAEIALLEPVVARLRSPGPTWHLRRSELALAYGRGEFGRARRLALESLRLAAHGHENMRTLTSAVIVRLNVMTGLDEWPADGDFSWSPPLGLAMRALWESAMGRPGEARRHYRPGDALATVPRIRYLITYAIFGELAAAFGDAPTADVVYQAMRPYADLFVCGGAGLTMVEGSVQRYLGLTAGVLGRLDEAVRWLRGAVQVNAREGMAACEALATLDLARALDRRGDRAEASALALSAAAGGERLGMLPLVRDARSLGASLDGSASAGPLTRRESEVAGLVARGLTNGQIAAALHISERTAENHVQHILIKLGLHTRTQIAVFISSGRGG